MEMGMGMGWVGPNVYPGVACLLSGDSLLFSTHAFDTNGWEAGLDLHML